MWCRSVNARLADTDEGARAAVLSQRQKQGGYRKSKRVRAREMERASLRPDAIPTSKVTGRIIRQEHIFV